MRLNLNKIIIKNADFILKRIKKHGFPVGHNGPYNDEETEVRSNAHWAIILFKAFEITKKKKYRDAARSCLDYLLSNEARPLGFTFYCRKNPRKDKCNGLIGQAWAVETLMEGFRVLKKEGYKQLAKKVFQMHRFDKQRGYWKRREINGKNLFYDLTFNHQLWFAATGASISDVNVKIFMNKLEKNISIRKNGLIRHLLWPNFTVPILFLKGKLNGKYLYNKEAGYHAFNLYALALLKKKFPKHSFWKSRKFKKIVRYSMTDEHLKISEKNKYGFPYNPSGIEQAFFAFIFKDLFKNYKEIMKERLQRQFARHLDKKTFLMDKNTSDPSVLASRIYEATRLPNLVL